MQQDILRRNNITITGESAVPMLFSHGFGCDQTMWRFVAPAFEADHKVVKYDLTGAGQSDLSAYDPARYGTLDGHADDILRICDALQLENVRLVGHSVSAITAVIAANRDPGRFDSLILVAPSPCFLNDGDYRGGFERADLEGLLQVMDENYLGWAHQFAPTVAGQPEDAAGASELTQSFCRTDPDIARQFARVTFLSDRRADLSRLQVSALALQCSEDVIAPVTVADWMRANMASTTVELLPVTGHCPHLTAPDLTVRAMRQYLDGR